MLILAHKMQGSTLPIKVGASKKNQTVAPWAIASIFTILNLSDCHNRQRMSVASRESDKWGGGGGASTPNNSWPSGKKVQSVSV